MDNLFLLIFLLSIVALIVGMIKPDWVLKFLEEGKRNRKHVFLVFGISLIASLILFGMTTDASENEEVTEDQVEEAEEVEEKIEEEVLLTLSDEDKELLEENYGELSSGQKRSQVDNILRNIDDYEDADQEFILQHKDRIEEEQVAFKEKERKEKEEAETEDTSGAFSKETAEQNAEEYPAEAGRVLVTKGDHEFTGMPYYFSGELIEVGTAEAFEGKTVWLIKNDNGYVMPVEMIDGEEAEIGSQVDVWGTLSGEGYQLPNVDNIVGETGYLIMMQYDLNGELVI